MAFLTESRKQNSFELLPGRNFCYAFHLSKKSYELRAQRRRNNKLRWATCFTLRSPFGLDSHSFARIIGEISRGSA